jgi:ribosomal-protein-alanine N-acetyltransferase
MESPCQVRLATAADVPAIAVIERAVFADPWSDSAFRELLGPCSFVAVSDGEVAGYVFARAVADEGEILNVAVREDLRGRGLGRRLLDAVFDDFRRHGVRTVYLEVRTSNTKGRAFYERLGFRQVGRRRAYYNKPREDALVMAREITLQAGPRRSG